MKRIIILAATALATLAALYLLWQLLSIVVLVLFALALTATMSGFVTTLTNRGVAHRRARLFVIVTSITGLVLFVLLTLYVLGERLPVALEDFRTTYGRVRSDLALGSGLQSSILQRLPPASRLDDLLLGTDGSLLLSYLIGLGSNLGAWISNLALVILLASYWLADRQHLEKLWLSLLLPHNRPRVRELFYEIEVGVGAYIRSEVIQAVLSIALLAIGYWLLGVKYPLLLAWACALLWLLPLIGAVLAIVPAILIGVLGGPWIAILTVLYTLLIFVLMEFVVERRIDLRTRPGSILGLLLALALIDVWGIVGLLAAPPLGVALQILLNAWLEPAPVAQPMTKELQQQELLDQLALIQSQMQAADTALLPPTQNLYQRMQALLEQIDPAA
jgi:putative permease